MPKLLAVGLLALAFDVLPFGRGCGCQPTTHCNTTCDCPQQAAAPIKCPGEWTCGASKTCEYVCSDLCLEDGGCPGAAGQTCRGSLCSRLPSCS